MSTLGKSSAVAVTTFPDVKATQKNEHQWTLSELAEHLVETTAETKAQLPLLKMARFGDQATAQGCLRSNDNLLAVSGIEADYDGGSVPLNAAVMTLRNAGISALLYPSPSHTEAAPRWRVICPFSEEYPADQRNIYMDRLNGLFGGIFAPESWTLSQSYYYGRVGIATDHRVAIVDGTPLDLHDELEQIGKPDLARRQGSGSGTGTTAARLSGLNQLGPRPRFFEPLNSRGPTNVAAVHGIFSLVEVDAAVASIPAGCPGHPLGKGAPWREEFLFPLASFAADNPEHRGEIRALFCEHTRRIADPVLVAADPDGPEIYFENAEKRFDTEVRMRSSPNGQRPDQIGIGRLIYGALGNREEAVKAGWGGRWDGTTALHQRSVLQATTQAAAPSSAPIPASAAASTFLSPIPQSKANLHAIPWLIDGIAARGRLTMLAGQGGGSKSAVAVLLAVAVAAGRPACGPLKIHQHPDRLPVIFISCEEDENQLGLLCEAASAVLQLNAAERARVGRNLMVHDAQKDGWAIGRPRPDKHEQICPEDEDQNLILLRQEMARIKPALVILDTVAGLIALQNENDNMLVTAMLRRIGKLVASLDSAALLIHHTPKMNREGVAANRGEASLVRGGSAWVNTPRVVLSLTGIPQSETGLFALLGTDPKQVRRLEHVKINDRRPMDPAYCVTRPILVPVANAPDIEVRAVEFITPPTAASAITDAVRNLVMKVIDAGVTDDHGVRLPLSPPGAGGKSSKRAAVNRIAHELHTSGGYLTDESAMPAAREVLKDLQEHIGCVVVTDVRIPKYKTDGAPDGKRAVKGLATRWNLAPWVLPPTTAAQVSAQVQARGLAGAPPPPTAPEPAAPAPAGAPGQAAANATRAEEIHVRTADLRRKLIQQGYTPQDLLRITHQQIADIMAGEPIPPPGSAGDTPERA